MNELAPQAGFESASAKATAGQVPYAALRDRPATLRLTGDLSETAAGSGARAGLGDWVAEIRAGQQPIGSCG